MPDLQQRGLQQRGLHQRGLRFHPTTHPLAVAARGLAHELLESSPGRWRHTQGVADRAAHAARTVPPVDRPVLVAAAWLHDIGYAEELRRCGFHPLDGAWGLQDRHWCEPIPGLVAHHSAARLVAAAHGLADQLGTFPAVRYASGPVADALTYADQTTGPDGEVMDVEDRLADMLRRHGPDSPNARAHAERAPAIRAAVQRTEARLRGGS